MAAGVPTVTSDFPAAREFIDDGQTGHRFPIGDAQRLAELICWHRDHPAESAQMGQRGRALVQDRYSEENTVARYVDIYRQLARPSTHSI
jgi:glycosyltransferase involved in cell wall biosynthesis